jgi:myo-inositol-1(or 4)-monophosphatase
VHLTDAELAITAAEAGAAVVRSKYGTALRRFEKSSTDFATEADLTAEEEIKHVLRAARPTDGFVGEETGRSGPERATRAWLVDPLCGTLNYAAQTPLVAVNVALREGDVVVAAATVDPFAGEVFWTDGEAAHRRYDSADEGVRPSAGSRLVELNLDPPYPNHNRFRVSELLSTTVFTDLFKPRVLSTTLALAWVADGRRAAYVSDGHLDGNVHFASGLALCEAAGATVTGLLGQPMHSGVGGLVAAADAQTHAALVDAIRYQFEHSV